MTNDPMSDLITPLKLLGKLLSVLFGDVSSETLWSWYFFCMQWFAAAVLVTALGGIFFTLRKWND